MYLIYLLLLLVLLTSQGTMSRNRYPLNFNYTYKFLRRGKNGDSSNPWRFKLLNSKEIIDQWGYQGEEHNVTTEDGYILSIYRIRPKRSSSPPVLINHGVLFCSEIYLLRGPGEDLAFLLSDAGYDVWLGNFRGNYNGRGHVNMSTDDENFWKFSIHEPGYYDLAAHIDYILTITGYSNLTLAAHSYANAITMVLMSQRPQYNNKVNLFLAIAPYVFADHVLYGPLLQAALIPLKRYCYRTRKFELLERRDINPAVRICDILPLICILALSITTGPINAKYILEQTPIEVAYFPSGTNLFTLMHISNINTQGRFCQLDLGRSQNRLRYGTDEPPDYDLSRVTVPVQIYTGTKDFSVDVRDAGRFARSLPNLINIRFVPYNHYEVITAPDTKSVYYDHLVKLVGKYSKRQLQPDTQTGKPPR